MTVPTTSYDTDQIATELSNVSTAGTYSSDDLFDSTEIDDFDIIPNASNAADLKTEPNDTDKFRAYVNFHPSFVIASAIYNAAGQVKTPSVVYTSGGTHYDIWAYDSTYKILIKGTSYSGISPRLGIYTISNDFNTQALASIDPATGYFTWNVSCVKFLNGNLLVSAYASGVNNSTRLYKCPIQSTASGYFNTSNWTNVNINQQNAGHGEIRDILYYSGRYYFVTTSGEVGSLNTNFFDGKLHIDLDRSFTKCTILGNYNLIFMPKFIAWDTSDDPIWCYLADLPTSNSSHFNTFDAQDSTEYTVYQAFELNGCNFILTYDNKLYKVTTTGTTAELISSNTICIGIIGSYIYIVNTLYNMYRSTYAASYWEAVLTGSLDFEIRSTIFEY